MLCFAPVTGSTGFKGSTSSFLFSLINYDGKPAAKLPIQNSARAIYNSPSHGPWFGTSDLVISDMAGDNLNSSSRPGATYNLPSGVTSGSVDAVNLLAGSEYFVPDIMEVYHVGKMIYFCARASLHYAFLGISSPHYMVINY